MTDKFKKSNNKKPSKTVGDSVDNNRFSKIALWAKIAKKNLETSRHLYENNIFPDSIYYFQQAIEKSAKTAILILDTKDRKSVV